MKKKNLLLVMLAIVLAFGLIACGPPEEEEEAWEWNPEDIYGTYTAVYTDNSVPPKTITETVVISKTAFDISDNYQPAGVSKDFLNFSITDWVLKDEDDKPLAPPSAYSGSYPYSFRFKGFVTGQKGYFGENSQTGKGFDTPDIKSGTNAGTEAWMYIYFNGDEDTITFVRTPLSKTGATENKDVVQDGPTGSKVTRKFTRPY